MQAYEALRAELAQAERLEAQSNSIAPTRMTTQGGTVDLPTQVYSRLQALSGRQERARQALALLLDESGAQAGHLFLFDDGGLYAAASLGEADGGAELLATARRHIDAEFVKSMTDDATVVLSKGGSKPPPTTQTQELAPVLLPDDDESGYALAGIALYSTAGATRTPRADLTRAIGRSLRLAGDCVPRRVDP